MSHVIAIIEHWQKKSDLSEENLTVLYIYIYIYIYIIINIFKDLSPCFIALNFRKQIILFLFVISSNRYTRGFEIQNKSNIFSFNALLTTVIIFFFHLIISNIPVIAFIDVNLFLGT